MLLTPEIIATLGLDSFFLLFGALSWVISLKILLYYNPQSNDAYSFKLQKSSYLVATVLSYIFLVKLLMMLYFIYTLDKLSLVIPGAMCGVGVLDTSVYGIYLMIVKIINLYMFSFWLALHKKDISYPYNPYMKLKSVFFLIIFCFFIAEVVLEYFYFFAIEPKNVVDCCGAIFSTASQTFIGALLQQPNYFLYGAFYCNVAILLFGYFFKQNTLYALGSVLFLPVALISLIGYFGTYIYELPTHHCPFCLLQSDYNYIGYLLYILLYTATFFGMLVGFDEQKKFFNYSLAAILAYSALVSFYVFSYYLKNGVWLY